MGYREVMSLPIRTFWLMNSNVGRVLAERDLRTLTVQQARHGGEAGEAIRKHLLIEMGETGKVANKTESPLYAERDHEGFNELKALAALM